jgi:ribosome biogenesis GTPase
MLDEAFPEIAAIAPDCRFNDCAHETEPGCEVRAAVERGDLEAERLASFQKLRGELDTLAELQRAKAWRPEGRPTIK